MLYKGFTDEKDLGSQDETKCRHIYISHKDALQEVKQSLLPYAQGVEEARYYVEEALKENNIKIGTILDAEKEQEVAECEDIDMLHPENSLLNKFHQSDEHSL